MLVFRWRLNHLIFKTPFPKSYSFCTDGKAWLGLTFFFVFLIFKTPILTLFAQVLDLLFIFLRKFWKCKSTLIVSCLVTSYHLRREREKLLSLLLYATALPTAGFEPRPSVQLASALSIASLHKQANHLTPFI